jgi:PncC family amidohydrolase
MPTPEFEVHVGPLLSALSWTLSTAESCTGGLIGHLITEVPGSSGYYLGGVVSYSDQLKQQLLGVESATLINYGAVSQQTALEMASGIRERLGTDIGLSATGIAGPGGATELKPLGTTWIGISTSVRTEAHHFLWTGDRSQNKKASAQAALEILHQSLTETHQQG